MGRYSYSPQVHLNRQRGTKSRKPCWIDRAVADLFFFVLGGFAMLAFVHGYWG